jgi:hypothetical protein
MEKSQPIKNARFVLRSGTIGMRQERKRDLVDKQVA